MSHLRRLTTLLLCALSGTGVAAVPAVAASTGKAAASKSTMELKGSSRAENAQLACAALPRPARRGITRAKRSGAVCRGLTKLTPVAGASRADIGIAEQKGSSLGDQRLRDLRLRYGRRSLAWDWYQHDWQVAEVTEWVQAARAAGVDPLITFARSRLDAKRHTLPTTAQFTQSLRAFRTAFPWVRTFSAWNEANHCGEGTCRKAHVVARFYNAIRANCRGCKVLAADLLDMPNMITWVKAFKKAARHEPRYWGLHNYVSANRFDATRTVQLLQHTKGELWLTETGGLVARRNRSEIRLRQGTAHAASVTRYIFDTLARLDRRVTRVYLYHWKSTSPTDTWDSALVGPDDRPRPAMNVLRQLISSRAARR